MINQWYQAMAPAFWLSFSTRTIMNHPNLGTLRFQQEIIFETRFLYSEVEDPLSISNVNVDPLSVTKSWMSSRLTTYR